LKRRSKRTSRLARISCIPRAQKRFRIYPAAHPVVPRSIQAKNIVQTAVAGSEK
jgi:hypothetical protein